MNRAIGGVVLVLAVCLAAPLLAAMAQAAVPALVGILVFLAVLRLALPPGRRTWR